MYRKWICVVLRLSGFVAALTLLASCDESHHPLLGSEPAGKMTIDGNDMERDDSDQCNAVYWECDPSNWNSRIDSTFTVFYGPYGFQVHGDSVRVALYGYGEDEDWLLRLYWASETDSTKGKVLAGFRQSDTHCGIWTSVLIDTASAVVYQGKVVHWNAGESGSRYGLFEDGESYAVAWVRQSGEIVPIDFLSYHHRDEPRPGRLTYSQNGLKGYYLPVNADLGAVGVQVERGSIRDIRPFLRSSVCVEGECPEWLDFSCTMEEETVFQETSEASEAVVSQETSEASEAVVSQGTSEEAESLPQVAIDCSSVSVPQEVLDARDLVDELQGPRDENHSIWVRKMHALIESHGIEQLKECFVPLSYEPLTYRYDPPCTEHNEAYVAHKGTDIRLYNAKKALEQLEEEYGIPLACR